MAEIIALSGFMGCGKSTVAGLLAQKSSCFYFDLDDTIELEERRSVSGIFDEDGQDAFRELEFKYLERIISDFEGFDQQMIISLGGGTLTYSPSAELIKKNCKCVYLRAGVDQLVENLKIVGVQNRPLLRDTLSGGDDSRLKEKVNGLLAARAASYESAADFILDIDGMSPSGIAEKLSELLFVL